MAIAIEDTNLHNRISLYVLKVVGTSPRLLLLGFMLSTAFLSMWISDTATCAMMIPILLAVLDKVGCMEIPLFVMGRDGGLAVREVGSSPRGLEFEPPAE